MIMTSTYKLKAEDLLLEPALEWQPSQFQSPTQVHRPKQCLTSLRLDLAPELKND